MGKGYNNYMCKKPFHPGSKANIKRAWMAEQKTENDKKKQEELKVQYEKEQDLYNNRALLSTESKDKLELNFMYEAPPGAKRERQKEDDEPEYKFEWQRKYNAPREDYAKGNADIKDQPFGIPVRNVRCIKCHKWGHINTDRECPLFSQASTSSMPTTSMDPLELMRQMREDGYGLKQNVLGHHINPKASNQQLIPSDESDPEMDFLKSLSSKQKRKLLRKLNKLSKKQERNARGKKKKSKKYQDSKSDSDSGSEDERETKKSKSKHVPESSESDSSSDKEIIYQKEKKEKRERLSKVRESKNSSSSKKSEAKSSKKRETKDTSSSSECDGRNKSERKTWRTTKDKTSKHLSIKKEVLEDPKQNRTKYVVESQNILKPVKTKHSDVFSKENCMRRKRKTSQDRSDTSENDNCDVEERTDKKEARHKKITKSNEFFSQGDCRNEKVYENKMHLEKNVAMSALLTPKKEPKSASSDTDNESSSNVREFVKEDTKVSPMDTLEAKLAHRPNMDDPPDQRSTTVTVSEQHIADKPIPKNNKVNKDQPDYDHPDGFNHLCPQAKVDFNYLHDQKIYKGCVHEKFREYNRFRRSPSVKHKYVK